MHALEEGRLFSIRNYNDMEDVINSIRFVNEQLSLKNIFESKTDKRRQLVTIGIYRVTFAFYSYLLYTYFSIIYPRLYVF